MMMSEMQKNGDCKMQNSVSHIVPPKKARGDGWTLSILIKGEVTRLG
jgi:hypothetical protein